MEFAEQVNSLYEQWKKLKSDGQTVTAEELCDEVGLSSRRDLIVALEKRIESARAATHVARTHTVAGLDATAYSDADEQDGSKIESEKIGDGEVTRISAELSTLPPETLDMRAATTRNEAPTDDDDIFSVSHFRNFVFIARGGLGEVCRASEQELGRNVALKFIRQERAIHEESRRLFTVEGEVTARLEHPGVVPIYGFGSTSDGVPFYAMRLIRGETLEQRISDFHTEANGSDLKKGEHAVPFRTLLTRFVSVCNTIAYAHSRGIIHRDIKPHNIMLGRYSETLVVDWGLARTFERDETDRASGEVSLMPGSADKDPEFSEGVVGTPNYMSPEQADGSIRVSKPTDIYSLGATLYRLLTGKMAIRERGISAILERVRRGDFRRPREVNPMVPAALEAICVKAMSLAPHDRYESALELAADIERYLADEPVTAFPEPWSRRARRWMQRHNTLTQVIAGALLATVVAVTAIVVTGQKQRRELVLQQLDRLKTKANIEERMLVSDFLTLGENVRFLASRPETTFAIEADVADGTAEAREKLADFFRDFIQGQSDYMQARLIAAEGREIVRVDRDEPGGDIRRTPDSQLQDKGGKPYLIDTLGLEAGKVYLSKLELNEDNGVKDWDFPAVRAAVPVFGPADQTAALGIVIINMHFKRLADLVQNEADDNLLVFLTNDQGQFLLHPVPGVGFSFERQLDYRIEEVYPKLAQFFASRDPGKLDYALPSTTSVGALLIEANEVTDEYGETLQQIVGAIIHEHPHVHVKYSGLKTRAIITGIERRQMTAIRRLADQHSDATVVIRNLSRADASPVHAVYCRKIFFDPRQPKRFLNLVIAQPYK